MNRLGKLLMSMLKVGCIGFGGGNALIPVIEKEIVKEQKLVSQEEYNKFVVVSNITPGALPVEMAVALGKAIAGIPGMLLAPICIALPGGLATLLLIIAFAKFSHIGIAAYILYMLFLYNKKVIDSFELVEMKLKRIAVILCVCVLTFGKELYHILGVKAQPIFDISTIHVLLLAFFVIFSTGKGMTKRRFCIDLIVSLCYVLCVGKTQIITNVYFLRVLYLIMFLIAANGIYESFSGQVTKVKRL
jgi:chromate transporter